MASRVEEIDDHLRRAKAPGWKRFLKACLVRARRRAERRDPEAAPGRVRDLTRGWAY